MHLFFFLTSLLGRAPERIAFIEAYLRAQGMFRDYNNHGEDPVFTDVVELDLDTIKPALSGPKRPHDHVLLSNMKKDFQSVTKKNFWSFILTINNLSA
jgi:aconitate hydratase